MSNHNTPVRPARGRSRGWFQFSLRTALGMMVVLAVALGWLADRSKLQQQLAEERLEKEALRIARDYMGQDYGDSILDPLDNCVEFPNPDLLDADEDGIGDRYCDPTPAACTA